MTQKYRTLWQYKKPSSRWSKLFLRATACNALPHCRGVCPFVRQSVRKGKEGKGRRLVLGSIGLAHPREHASNALSSLTRAAGRTATACSLQTQTGAVAG